MIAGICALVAAVLAIWCAFAAGVYATATTHLTRAADHYRAYRPADGDAERKRGQKLMRRAERMIPVPRRRRT